ncbi:hypothetical protein QE152_g32324 [Popillia japonica]|uniref:Reverse transcriptase n=1 Tax=Popillia japonica TaxID=7064 RepID=A0AAW1IZV9_POPJA
MLMRVHIQKTAEKAGKVLANLCRLMPNVGGPRERSRRMLCTVMESIIMYGASIWGKAVTKEVHCKVLRSVQRNTAIRVVSAYRTASTSALQAIARMPPIDLLVEHRAAVESQGGHSKDREYRGIMAKWQARWDTENGTASWTRRLIKELQPWCARAHGEVNFFLAQFLTGHGCFQSYLTHGEVNFFLAKFLTGHGSFQSYLKRFGLESSDACLYCGGVDTVEHTFFECPRWSAQRARVKETTGEINPDTVVPQMISSQKSWNAVDKMVREILSEKDSRHRRRDKMVREILSEKDSRHRRRDEM